MVLKQRSFLCFFCAVVFWQCSASVYAVELLMLPIKKLLLKQQIVPSEICSVSEDGATIVGMDKFKKNGYIWTEYNGTEEIHRALNLVYAPGLQYISMSDDAKNILLPYQDYSLLWKKDVGAEILSNKHYWGLPFIISRGGKHLCLKGESGVSVFSIEHKRLIKTCNEFHDKRIKKFSFSAMSAHYEVLGGYLTFIQSQMQETIKNFYWYHGGFFTIPFSNEYYNTHSQITAISKNGQFIAGEVGLDAFIYQHPSNSTQFPPMIIRFDEMKLMPQKVILNGINQSGDLVIGTIKFLTPDKKSKAFIWTPHLGIQFLEDILPYIDKNLLQNKVLQNYEFSELTHLSGNERVLVGVSYSENGHFHAHPRVFRLKFSEEEIHKLLLLDSSQMIQSEHAEESNDLSLFPSSYLLSTSLPCFNLFQKDSFSFCSDQQTNDFNTPQFVDCSISHSSQETNIEKQIPFEQSLNPVFSKNVLQSIMPSIPFMPQKIENITSGKWIGTIDDTNIVIKISFLEDGTGILSECLPELTRTFHFKQITLPEDPKKHILFLNLAATGFIQLFSLPEQMTFVQVIDTEKIAFLYYKNQCITVEKDETEEEITQKRAGKRKECLSYFM